MVPVMVWMKGEEELAGLDIGEHGNIAYPDFASVDVVTDTDGESVVTENTERSVEINESVPVVYREHTGVKITLVTIITNQTKFAALQDALDN